MGDDSAGPGPPSQPDGLSSAGRICLTPSCGKPILAVGRGNHHYCEDCKKSRAGSPALTQSKAKQKRDNSSLSPIEQNLPKMPKGDRDDDKFAFRFNAAFGCDFDSFLELDRSDALARFKMHFSNFNEQAEIARAENNRLAEQIQSLKSKLNTAKLAFADKHIKLYESGQSLTSGPAERRPTSNAPAPQQKPPLPKQVLPPDNRPTLVAWLRKDVPRSDISLDSVDSILDLDSNGPVV